MINVDNMPSWRERLIKAVAAWKHYEFLKGSPEIRMDRVFKESGVRDLVVANDQLSREVEALRARVNELEEFLASLPIDLDELGL